MESKSLTNIGVRERISIEFKFHFPSEKTIDDGIIYCLQEQLSIPTPDR